ncbi:MAG: 50S ribosomal protein L6 [Rickettsiales bacterium]|jgi:large subunit ribosomal protein L6|nr:50S ribosomal protein L6 [Rickettsiales bacterium]
MSRAGKYPVEIKNGVNVAIVGSDIVVRGPRGELKLRNDTKNAGLVDVKIEGAAVVVIPKDAEDKASRAMWGTMARNIKQMVVGVTDGWSKDICMKGVGYKANVRGSDLVLTAGYSHDVVMPIPAGLSVEIGATENGIVNFAVRGTDKNAVGQFSDKICKVRPVEPYKAKGIYYKGQKIIRKEGKKK